MKAAEKVFDEVIQQMPVPLDPSHPVEYRTNGSRSHAAEASAPIRHVAGHPPFLAFRTTHPTRAEDVAGELAAPLALLRRHVAGSLGEGVRSTVASIFSGNTLAHLRLDAQWRSELDVAAIVDNDDAELDVTSRIEHLRMTIEDQIDSFVDAAERWSHHELLPAPIQAPRPTATRWRGYTHAPPGTGPT